MYFKISLLGEYFYMHNVLSEGWDPSLNTKFIYVSYTYIMNVILHSIILLTQQFHYIVDYDK